MLNAQEIILILARHKLALVTLALLSIVLILFTFRLMEKTG